MYAAVHVHSDRSYDGRLAVGELREFLKSQGIGAALMAEHAEDFDNGSYREYAGGLAEASGSGFFFVPGLEFRCEDGPHVLGLGLGEYFAGVPPAAELLSWMREQGAVTVLAHPSYPAEAIHGAIAPLCDAVEVWNVPCEGGLLPDPRKFRVYEEMRRRNPRLLAVGGIDLHSVSGYKRVLLRTDGEGDWGWMRERLLAGRYRIEAGRWRFASQPELHPGADLALRAAHGGFRAVRRLRDLLAGGGEGARRRGAEDGKGEEAES